MLFLYSLQSEWLKTRRSAASWLCLAGGFFLPCLFLFGFIQKSFHLNRPEMLGHAWMSLADRLWFFMAILLLPTGLVLAASLMLQIEHRSGGWKQLHTTPQPYSHIFFAKLLTIFFMTLKFFLFFNIGLLIVGYLPTWIFSGRSVDEPLPVLKLLQRSGAFFISCLPVLAIQYMLSLLFRNFLIPVGIGLAMVIGSLILVEAWAYAWLNPYCYSPMLLPTFSKVVAPVGIHWLSAGYTLFFTGLAFLLYRYRMAKG